MAFAAAAAAAAGGRGAPLTAAFFHVFRVLAAFFGPLPVEIPAKTGGIFMPNLTTILKRDGRTVPYDEAKIAAAIPKVTHSGLTGTMAFDADGERKDAEIAILEEKGGKFDVIEMVK